MPKFNLLYNHGFVGVTDERGMLVVDTDWPERKAIILRDALEDNPSIDADELYKLVEDK